MRIALVGARNFPAEHGGIEVVVEQLARQLAARGHKVDVFVGKDAAATDTVDGLRVLTSPSLRGKYLETVTQVASGIRDVRRARPDVVHVHGVGPALSLLPGRRVFGGAPVVVTVHGADWQRAKWPKLASHLFRLGVRLSLPRATAVTAVSSSLGRICEKNFPVRPVVIENGVAAIDIPEATSDGMSGTYTPYALCVSRLVPEKSIETVLAAFQVGRSLSPHLRGMELLVVGSGEGSYADDYARRLHGLAGQGVRFLGRVDARTTRALMRSARVFVSASTLEGLPLSVMEAAVEGAPLVLSDIPPHREIVGGDARFFPKEDVSALAVQLVECMEAVARPSGESFRTRFDWVARVDEYEALYRRVVA